VRVGNDFARKFAPVASAEAIDEPLSSPPATAGSAGAADQILV
jgi:hypothetical protein